MDFRLIDSHCHPQFPQYDADREEMLARARSAGVGMVCIGTDHQTSVSAVALADTHEGVFATVGLHPNDDEGVVPILEGDEHERYRALAASAKVVGIGEVGLDYYRAPDAVAHRIQAERFIRFSSLARETGKPLVIHCREAHHDMIALMDRDVPSIIHSFNGSPEQARSYLNFGCLLGLNAIVTYSKQYEGMVKMVPLDRVLIETDAPYLAPAPHRGQRNEPLYIERIAEEIARMKGVPVDDFLQNTVRNAQQFYRL